MKKGYIYLDVKTNKVEKIKEIMKCVGMGIWSVFGLGVLYVSYCVLWCLVK